MGLGYSVREVDHLYAFFVQWSPEIYGKDAKDQGFVVVEKDELEVIDNFFSDPIPKSWEDAAYRKDTEQTFNQRFNLVKSECDVQNFEDKINCGQMEEVISQAETELSVAYKMTKWKL